MSLLQNLVGQKAIITIRNCTAAQHGPFAHTEPDTIDIEGTVLARPHWQKDMDWVAMAVPHSEVPLRMIPMRNIVMVNGTKFMQPKIKPAAEHTFKIHSSRGDSFYEVSLRNGSWSCSCVANKSFNKICRHITEAKGKL